MNTSFPVDFDSPKNTYYEILYVSRQPSLSSFGAKPLSSPPVSALQISTQISSQEENIEAYDFYNQEMSGYSKKFNAMKNVGLLPQHWENINTTYISLDIFDKYNLRPQS